MEALTFSPLEALKKGWALTKKHFFVSVGLLGLYLVLAVFCVVLAGTKPAAFRFWISATVLLLITLFFFIGFDKFLLAVARERTDLYASFGAIRKIGPSILLLPSVIVATGFVALVLAMLSTVLRGLVPAHLSRYTFKMVPYLSGHCGRTGLLCCCSFILCFICCYR